MTYSQRKGESLIASAMVAERAALGEPKFFANGKPSTPPTDEEAVDLLKRAERYRAAAARRGVK